jgi:hypothetical protein
VVSSKGPTGTSATSSYAFWRSSGRSGRCQAPDTQIKSLKAQNAELKDRVTDRDATIEEPTEFKKLALSRFAALHDEIMRLRSPQSPSEPPPPAQPTTVPCATTTVSRNCH